MEQGHTGGVLGDPGRPVPRRPQEPVGGGGRGGVLRLDDGVAARLVGLPRLTGGGAGVRPGQGGVNGDAGAVGGQVEGGALVGGGQRGHEGVGDLVGPGLRAGARGGQALGDKAPPRLGEEVRTVVLGTRLQGGVSSAPGLDLQEGEVGVQVGAGAYLEPTPSPAGCEVVGVQVGGVEVGRGVGEGTTPADLEDLGVPQGVDQVLGRVDRQEVLAVHPGQEAGGSVELGQGDGGQAVSAYGGHVRPASYGAGGGLRGDRGVVEQTLAGGVTVGWRELVGRPWARGLARG